MNKLFLTGTVVLITMIAGCGARPSSESAVPEPSQMAAEEALLSRDIFAMDTYMTISAYGDEAQAALDEAEAELVRLDELLSAEDEDSEIAALNANGSGIVSDDTVYLVTRALQIHDETKGAFEIAIYPVKRAWGFTDQNYRVPLKDEIEELLPLADSGLISINENEKQITLEKAGMAIDLGGIAKGYASERIAEIFKSHNVRGLINLGGNVQAACWKSTALS